MTVSVVENLSSAFTDVTLPKAPLDALINSGTLFLFDFLNSYCNPNADGNLPNGASFANMLDGAPSLSYVKGTSPGFDFSNVSGKAGVATTGHAGGSTVSSGYLDFGASMPDLSASNDEFVVCMWLKIPSSGLVTTAFQRIFGLTTSNNNTCQWTFDSGPDGKTIRGVTGTGSGTFAASLASGDGLDAAIQTAFHWKPGAIEIYKNGVLVQNITGLPATLQSASGAPVTNRGFNGVPKFVLYRCWQEDLILSGNSAAAQIAADYAANSGRFV